MSRWTRAAVAAAMFGFVCTAALPAGAVNGNLIVGHGSFEQPPVTRTPWILYPAGQSFDGWTVSTSSVAVGVAYAGIVAPTDGAQFLSLVDPGTQHPQAAGQVCRTVATTPGHKYRVTLDAASLWNAATILITLDGTVRSLPIGASGPAAYTHLETTVGATHAHAAFCVSAQIGTSSLTFPLIDKVRVADLG